MKIEKDVLLEEMFNAFTQKEGNEYYQYFKEDIKQFAFEYAEKRLALLDVSKLVTVEYWKAYYGGYTKAVKHHKENNYCQSKYQIGQCFNAWINAPENRHLKR